MAEVNFCFENKKFVVVGASSGIGRQITLDLAKSGAHVLAIGRNEARLIEVQGAFPNQIHTHQLDVTEAKTEDWDQILSEFVSIYGKINGGVYTAGITGMTGLKSYDDELAQRIVDTSFWGMVRFVQSASRKKNAEKGSSYIMFSAAGAYTANKGQFAYVAAKGAVQIAVRSWAKEICRDKHRINSISPGWVETDMTKNFIQFMGWNSADEVAEIYPLGLGKPQDISGVVLFMLSDMTRWITGTDVVVDGGLLLGTF